MLNRLDVDLAPEYDMENYIHQCQITLIFPEFFRTYGYSAKGGNMYIFFGFCIECYNSRGRGKLRGLYNKVSSQYEFEM